MCGLEVPPIRDRKEDLPMLAQELFERVCKMDGRQARQLRTNEVTIIMANSWPGNVRELENALAEWVAGGNLSFYELERAVGRRHLQRLPDEGDSHQALIEEFVRGDTKFSEWQKTVTDQERYDFLVYARAYHQGKVKGKESMKDWTTRVFGVTSFDPIISRLRKKLQL